MNPRIHLDILNTLGQGVSVGKVQGRGNLNDRIAFDAILSKKLETPGYGSELKVSTHAEKRIQERNIEFGEELRKTLSRAVDELQLKGARDSLILTDEGAFLVSVPNRTIVTAMDVNEMRDRAVTQIDSVRIT